MAQKVSPQGPDGAIQYNDNKKFRGSGYLAVDINPLDFGDTNIVYITDYVNADINKLVVNNQATFQSDSSGQGLSVTLTNSTRSKMEFGTDAAYRVKNTISITGNTHNPGIASREAFFYTPAPPVCSAGNGSDTTLKAQNSSVLSGGKININSGTREGDDVSPVNTGDLVFVSGIGFGTGNKNGDITLQSGTGFNGVRGGDVTIAATQSNEDAVFSLGTHSFIWPKTGGGVGEYLCAGVPGGVGEPYQSFFA
jgi:hypothetical protein